MKDLGTPTKDLGTFIKRDFDGAWNARDADKVLDFFADDAVVRMTPPMPGAPETFTGRDEIRGFVEMLIPGFRVASKKFRVDGNRVAWHSTVSCDALRQLGLDTGEANSEAVVRGNKITYFNPTFTKETLAKIEAAG